MHDDGGLLWPGTHDRAAEMALRQAMPRKAGLLRRLHHGPGPLVLPNAWDVASARVCAAAGFPAVATTSVGVVEALGHADDDSAPVDEVFAVLRRIAGAVDVPLTVDVEAGYGLAPGELAARVIDAGAVGLNLEDTDHRAGGLRDVTAQAERIAGLKAAGRSLGVDLVINARIDVHLAEVGDPAGRLDDAISRARRYSAAGADCVYPIMLEDPEDLETFVAAVALPVNALLRSGGPTLESLQQVGIRRVSTGSGLWRASLGAVTAQVSALAARARRPV